MIIEISDDSRECIREYEELGEEIFLAILRYPGQYLWHNFGRMVVTRRFATFPRRNNMRKRRLRSRGPGGGFFVFSFCLLGGGLVVLFVGWFVCFWWFVVFFVVYCVVVFVCFYVFVVFCCFPLCPSSLCKAFVSRPRKCR